jgi:hypothetical protein
VDFGKRNFANFVSSGEIKMELRNISRWPPQKAAKLEGQRLELD